VVGASVQSHCSLVLGTNGWIHNLGALDFAGGTVVHISSAAAALACAICVGRRREFGSSAIMPHNLPMTVLGAGILWFGWFGFNAGSALAANGLAANAFVVTHLAAAAATVSWVAIEWHHNGKPTTSGPPPVASPDWSPSPRPRASSADGGDHHRAGRRSCLLLRHPVEVEAQV